MTHFFVALKGQKLQVLLSKMICSHLEQGEMTKKKEELPQLCVCSMAIEASCLPLIAILIQLRQLLFLFLLKLLSAQDMKHLFGQHFEFFIGVNEANYKKWD